MRIGFNGSITDSAVIKAGFIGCGSHSFRNIYPALQFAPVHLVAVCDFDAAKAGAFAAKFGAQASYTNHKEMLSNEDLDAVFICTGYNEQGRPQYPKLAIDCLEANCHVWIEKPPAASCIEIQQMQEAATRANKNVVVGMKKMFFPANEKAYELMTADSFGTPHLVTLQYPQYVPTTEEFADYIHAGKNNSVVWFLDHICHPASLLVFLLGMPDSMYYERSNSGGGIATFCFDSGVVASIILSNGASMNGGMEHTLIVSDKGQHITIENNRRVTLHRLPPLRYGESPSFYEGLPEQTAAVWEPEFSLGQLYNKGLFLLGYVNEINEFACSILENRPPAKGTLKQAWQVTRIFEAFAEGPGKKISLS